MRTPSLLPRADRRTALCVLLASGLLVNGAQARAASAPETLLDFCLANPATCAISVFSIDEGWERHLNPDRPQVLASTMKTPSGNTALVGATMMYEILCVLAEAVAGRKQTG